jgi:hypothetical protein
VKRKQLALLADSNNQTRAASDNNDNTGHESESERSEGGDSSIPLLVERYKSIGESLTGNADSAAVDEDADPDEGVDPDTIIDGEAEILGAAKHLAMARAPRKLF